jgi:hypothetical protein
LAIANDSHAEYRMRRHAAAKTKRKARARPHLKYVAIICDDDAVPAGRDISIDLKKIQNL